MCFTSWTSAIWSMHYWIQELLLRGKKAQGRCSHVDPHEVGYIIMDRYKAFLNLRGSPEWGRPLQNVLLFHCSVEFTVFCLVPRELKIPESGSNKKCCIHNERNIQSCWSLTKFRAWLSSCYSPSAALQTYGDSLNCRIVYRMNEKRLQERSAMISPSMGNWKIHSGAKTDGWLQNIVDGSCFRIN